MTARHRPVLFVTNLVAPDRVGAFAALHAAERIELALFAGRSHHATAAVEDPGVPHRHVRQRDVARLAASGRYRAVVCGTAGRVALPGAFAGARRAGVPFVLWSALWAPLRTPAHLAAAPLMARIYRASDAVVTYGDHVSAFARARGARHVHVAPQAVDNGFWGAGGGSRGRSEDPFAVTFIGRDAKGKGVEVLLEAWRAAGLASASAALVLVGVRPDRMPADADAGDAVRAVGPQPAEAVRNFCRRADVLVMPSVPTRSFREPWGLVANEAMNQGVPIIATDAVGAVAGGLVRHERNGLVVPAADAGALAAAIARLHADRALCARLGAAGARDVAAFTFSAWADGFSAALSQAGSSEKEC